MANRKEYELMLQLRAAVGSDFNKTFNSAINTTKNLQGSLQAIKKVQGDVTAYEKAKTAITAQKNIVQELAQKHGDLQQKLSQTVTKEKELQKASKDSKKTTGEDTEEYKKLSKELDKIREDKSKLNKQIKDNINSTEKANQNISDEKQKLSELGEKLKATGIDTENLTDENKKLQDSYDKLKNEQEKIARLDKWERETTASLSKARTDFIKTTAVVTAFGTAFYKAFITPAAAFEEQMSTVEAISGATAEQMAQLNELAKETGATTKFTAVESGQALEYMAMAGWKTEQMLNGMDGIVNLAAASGEDLAIVSDIVTDSLTAFGLSANDATHFSDVLAAAATNSNTNVGMMGESFKYAAPLAGQFGFSIEDTAVLLGLMANSGIKASQAGTSLRMIFTQLTSEFEINGKKIKTSFEDGTMRPLLDIVNETRQAFNGLSEDEKKSLSGGTKEIAKELGIDLVNGDGTFKTLEQLDEQIDNVIEGLTAAGKVSEAEGFAEKRAMAGLLTIVGATDDEYNKLVDSIYDCNGAAQKMAQIRLDNLNGDIVLAKSAWEGFATTTGEVFTPQIREAVQSITDIIGKANEWVKENPELVKQIIETTGKVALLVVGLKAAKLAVAFGKKEIASIGKVLKSIGPAGGVATAAVTALVVALWAQHKATIAVSKANIESALFNNGGQKLSEITQGLKDSTSESYNFAKSINSYGVEIEELQSTIGDTRREIKIYGDDLRNIATLSPSEAEALIEPFNKLTTALKDKFSVEYKVVFDNFKLAAGAVATSLGADVKSIESVLDTFKQKYNNNLNESQAYVNEFLTRKSNGETLTDSEYAEFEKRSSYLIEASRQKSEAAKAYEETLATIAAIDIGENQDAAIKELGAMREYAEAYQKELDDAQKLINNTYDEFRRNAKLNYDYGYDSFEEYKNNLEAIEATQRISNEAYLTERNMLTDGLQAVIDKVQGQLNDAFYSEIEKSDPTVWNNVLGFLQADTSHLLNLDIDSWTQSIQSHVEENFRNDISKEFSDLNDEIKQVRDIVKTDPIRIPVEYYNPNNKYFSNENTSHGPYGGYSSPYEYYQAQQGYASGTLSATAGLHLVGENGPELIDFGGGERVYTADESRRMLKYNFPPTVNATSSQGGETTIKIEYKPILNFEKNAPDNLEEILSKNNEQIVFLIDDYFRKKVDNERRMTYN